MSRGDEAAQTKIDGIFEGDEPFYALVKVEPLVESIIEADKRLGRWYNERDSEIGKKEDEIKGLIDDIKAKFRYWEENNKEDSPAFHLILSMVSITVGALESYKSVVVEDIKFLKEFRLYSSTLAKAANGIQKHVAKQDERVEYLEEVCAIIPDSEKVAAIVSR
ncbi:MAG: hypothetical protein V3U02_12445 [Calditrichia bacterium]